MDNKKLITTIASAVAIVWIFCISFLVSTKVAHVQRDKAVTTLPFVQTTTAPSTEPTTTKPHSTLPRLDNIGNNVTVEASVGDPQWLIDEQASKKAEEESKKAAEASKKAEKETTTKPSIVPKGKQEIIDAYTIGVNKLKSEKNFTLNKNDTLDIVIDDITGGIESLAQSLISGNKPVPESYTFVSGVDSNAQLTPTGIIAPLNKNAAVNPEAVKSATVKENSDGGYTVKITLIDELQTLSTPAPNHSTMLEVVNEKDLASGGMTITQLDITYSGAYVEATFDKDNRIVSMYHHLPVINCVGKGKLGFIPGDVIIHGLYTSTYTVIY